MPSSTVVRVRAALGPYFLTRRARVFDCFDALLPCWKLCSVLLFLNASEACGTVFATADAVLGFGMHTAVIRLAVLVLGFHAVHTGKTPFIEPVPLQDVRLKPDSRFDKAVSLNREYLLGINSDRLLKTFR